MQVTNQSRLLIRLQNILFVIVFIGALAVIAWLSTRYAYQADITAWGRNTISPASQALLKKLEGPVTITSYARNREEVRTPIKDLVTRYQRFKPDLKLVFVNPDTAPEQVRKLELKTDGEMVITHGERSQTLANLNEQDLTNALQSVAYKEKPRLLVLTGHGERDPKGKSGRDLLNWVTGLQSKGMAVDTLNLGTTPQVPADTRVLILAGPQNNFLPGEVSAIQDYLDKRGNLLWLQDPGNSYGLEPVAKSLGITFIPGVIVNPTGQLFGVNRPEFTVVADYDPNPITKNFTTLTLFPIASGLQFKNPEGWTGDSFLKTQPQSWSETGVMTGKITRDKDEISGPLDIAFNIQRGGNPSGDPRIKTTPEQRVIVVGDGDFLSNSFLGNGGNVDLGLNMVNWLIHEDTLIAVPGRIALDNKLILSNTLYQGISIAFLFVLPLLLLLAGLLIWLRRRKR